MVEDIVYSGNMLHWSSLNNDLSIADIWGQQYVRSNECYHYYEDNNFVFRFQEIDPVTTTVPPETTATTASPETVTQTTQLPTANFRINSKLGKSLQ